MPPHQYALPQVRLLHRLTRRAPHVYRSRSRDYAATKKARGAKAPKRQQKARFVANPNKTRHLFDNNPNLWYNKKREQYYQREVINTNDTTKYQPMQAAAAAAFKPLDKAAQRNGMGSSPTYARCNLRPRACRTRAPNEQLQHIFRIRSIIRNGGIPFETCQSMPR